MLSGTVVLVTDRPDRCHAIAEAIRSVAHCEILSPDEPSKLSEPPLGIVADAGLSDLETARYLRALRATRVVRVCLLICLTRSVGEPAQAHARVLRATACLPAMTPPHTVVATLLRHIKAPEPQTPEAALQARVRQGAQRGEQALANLFGAAGSGKPVEMAKVDASLSPILKAVSDGGLTRWLDTVWAYDNATYQHCLLVAGLAARFALYLRFKEADQHRFVRAAMVHDVGKAQIPQAILNKPGKLDPDEMSVMRTHAALGYEILKNGGTTDALTLDAVRHHHEMLDGSGYPDGLSSNGISDVVRMLTICDIYAALTERRPYKEPMQQRDAMSILTSMAGKLEVGFIEAFGRSVSPGTSAL